MLTLERLIKLKKIVKIEALCREAGVSYATISSAMLKKTPLRQDVAQKLTLALRGEGLILAKDEPLEN